jgi:hypothetical protein
VSVVPQIERQLHDAAERLGQSPVSRAAARARQWRGRLLARPLLVSLLLASSASGVALAAKALVGMGSPAPREYPSFGERILPTGTRLLSLRVPDPAGGPPWGMRLIFTSAGGHSSGSAAKRARWGCVQVGRVVDGELGALGRDGAFHDDGLFHELPIQPEACGSVSRSGQLLRLSGSAHVETASAYQGLAGCVTEATKREQAIALPSIERELAVARVEHDKQGVQAALDGLASYRRVAPQVKAERACPASDLRHVYFGVAGPEARSVTLTGAGVHETLAVSPGDDGGYLVVLRPSRLQRVLSALKLPDRGRPASAPGRRASAPVPSSQTPLWRAAERNPATPNPVLVTPRSGGPHTAFKLTFTALLNGGGYSYAIETDGSARCQREAERATGGDGVAVGRVSFVRGARITKILKPSAVGLCPGDYRIYVSFSNPKPGSLENFPFATVRFKVD